MWLQRKMQPKPWSFVQITWIFRESAENWRTIINTKNSKLKIIRLRFKVGENAANNKFTVKKKKITKITN